MAMHTDAGRDIYENALMKIREQNSAYDAAYKEYEEQGAEAEAAYKNMADEARINKALLELKAKKSDQAAGIKAKAGQRTIGHRSEAALRNELGSIERRHKDYRENVEHALNKLAIMEAAKEKSLAAQRQAQEASNSLSQGRFRADIGLQQKKFDLYKDESEFSKAYKLYLSRLTNRKQFKNDTGIEVKRLPRPKKVIKRPPAVTAQDKSQDANYVPVQYYDSNNTQKTYYVRKNVYEIGHRISLDFVKDGVPKSDTQLIFEIYGMDDNGVISYDTLNSNFQINNKIEELFGTKNYNIMKSYAANKVWHSSNASSEIETSMGELGDMVMNPDLYISAMGQVGYDNRLGRLFEEAADQLSEIGSINDKISNSDNQYSCRYVEEYYPYLKDDLVYTGSIEDKQRKMLGLVPEAFDSSRINIKPAVVMTGDAADDPQYVKMNYSEPYGAVKADFYVREDIYEKTERLNISLFDESGMPKSQMRLLMDLYGMNDLRYFDYDTLNENLESSREYVQNAFGLENYLNVKSYMDMRTWYKDFDKTGMCPAVDKLEGLIKSSNTSQETLKEAFKAAAGEINSLYEKLDYIHKSNNMITYDFAVSLDPSIKDHADYTDSEYDDICKAMGYLPVTVDPSILDGLVLPKDYEKPNVWDQAASREALGIWMDNKTYDRLISEGEWFEDAGGSEAYYAEADAMGDTFEAKRKRAEGAQLRIDSAMKKLSDYKTQLYRLENDRKAAQDEDETEAIDKQIVVIKALIGEITGGYYDEQIEVAEDNLKQLGKNAMQAQIDLQEGRYSSDLVMWEGSDKQKELIKARDDADEAVQNQIKYIQQLKDQRFYFNYAEDCRQAIDKVKNESDYSEMVRLGGGPKDIPSFYDIAYNDEPKVMYTWDYRMAFINNPELLNGGEKELYKEYYWDKNLEFLTEEQKDVLRYYYAKGEYAELDNYYMLIDRELNGRLAAAEDEERIKRYESMGEGGKWAAAGESILNAPLQVLALIPTLGQAIANIFGEYEPVDMNSKLMRLSQTTGKAREYATKDLEGMARFAADVGFSVADMVVVLPLGPTYSLGILSSEAAGAATNDALSRGATPWQALTEGVAAGVIEAATEKLPIDNLFKITKAAAKTGKKVAWQTVRSVLKEAGLEGAQEWMTEIANNLTDMAVMGNKSRFSLRVADLKKTGLSEAQAQKQTATEFFVVNPLKAFAGGVLAGGTLGTGGHLVGSLTGRTVSGKQNVNVKSNMMQIQPAQDGRLADGSLLNMIDNADPDAKAPKEIKAAVNSFVDAVQSKGDAVPAEVHNAVMDSYYTFEANDTVGNAASLFYTAKQSISEAIKQHTAQADLSVLVELKGQLNSILGGAPRKSDAAATNKAGQHTSQAEKLVTALQVLPDSIKAKIGYDAVFNALLSAQMNSENASLAQAALGKAIAGIEAALKMEGLSTAERTQLEAIKTETEGYIDREAGMGDNEGENQGKVDLSAKLKNDGYKILETKTAEKANEEWKARGYEKPPIKPDTEVYIVEAEDNQYIRFYNEEYGNMVGRWIIKKSDIKGMSLEEIVDKYALPNKPDNICDVNLPSDLHLEVSEANGLYDWGKGGGIQYSMMDTKPKPTWYSNSRKISTGE